MRAVREGRGVLMTTHSIHGRGGCVGEEGRNYISGRMLTVGTVEGLRRGWGDVWHVRLVMSSAPRTGEGEMKAVREWVKSCLRLPGAEVEEKMDCGQLRFCGACEGDGRDWGLFGLMEGNNVRMGIAYCSIGQTTMDEVFVDILRKAWRGGGE